MQIQWLDYLYSNSKLKLFDVIRSYNMPLPSDLSETYECVELLIEQYGDEVEKKLLKCFPEYNGIQNMVREEVSGSKKSSSYFNFAGEQEYVEQKINKLESKLEIDNCKSEIEKMKRSQTILLVAIGILLYAQFKK